MALRSEGGTIRIDARGYSNVRLRKSLGDILVGAKLITSEQLTAAVREQEGGAMSLGDAATVANCVFIDNRATSEDGGAIRSTFDDGVTIRHCTFIENQAADDGGAIAMRDHHTQVIDCLFIRNAAGDNGGAIFARNGNSALAESKRSG